MTDTPAPFARVAINFYRHPKIRRLTKDAQHLYLASILHCVEFKTDGRFPADETPLLASVSRVRPSLADELVDVGVWQRDGDDVVIRDFLEWQSSAEQRNARSEAAKKAAEARWEAERNANGTADGTANRNAEPMLGRGRGRENTSRDQTRDSPDPPGFEQFWEIWPRREARARAVKAFRTATRKTSVDAILDGARAYVRNCEQRKVEPSYIAHATTWLNGERWNDDLPQPPDPFQPPKQVIG